MGCNEIQFICIQDSFMVFPQDAAEATTAAENGEVVKAKAPVPISVHASTHHARIRTA